ncbi:hypothetical protein BDN72DRAFT_865410 [Pluteus cervinus]|uniref:Uncharacterized protein n=1 Tax=Pluteus cervinus TaxID=181527 RepID=A0ACD3A0E9_9AGAR|nr:hypothetical protein BDN72DRAFT_865410 [Pluteus cervinus]
MSSIWDDKELQILNDHLELWKKDGGSRRLWANKIWNIIYPARGGKMNKVDKKKLWTALTNWLSNNKRDPEKRKKLSYVKHWSFRTVLLELHSKDIRTIARDKNPELKPDKKIPVGVLQKALTEFIAGLSEEEVEHAREQASEWNGTGPPPEVQARNADSKAGAEIRRITDHLYRQYGMAVIMFTVHRNSQGRPSACMHDYNKWGIGVPFETEFPKWETETKMAPIWDQYGERLFGSAPLRRPILSSRIPQDLERDKHGWPLIPEEDPAKPWTHDEMKALIRLFFRICYRIAAANNNATPSWSVIEQLTDQFINSEFLPDGFKFRDPWKLREQDARTLMNFFYERQEDDTIPITFCFKAYRNGKGPAANIETAKPVGSKMVTAPARRRIVRRTFVKVPPSSEEDNGRGKERASKPKPKPRRSKRARRGKAALASEPPTDASDGYMSDEPIKSTKKPRKSKGKRQADASATPSDSSFDSEVEEPVKQAKKSKKSKGKRRADASTTASDRSTQSGDDMEAAQSTSSNDDDSDLDLPPDSDTAKPHRTTGKRKAKRPNVNQNRKKPKMKETETEAVAPLPETPYPKPRPKFKGGPGKNSHGFLGSEVVNKIHTPTHPDQMSMPPDDMASDQHAGANINATTSIADDVHAGANVPGSATLPQVPSMRMNPNATTSNLGSSTSDSMNLTVAAAANPVHATTSTSANPTVAAATNPVQLANTNPAQQVNAGPTPVVTKRAIKPTSAADGSHYQTAGLSRR